MAIMVREYVCGSVGVVWGGAGGAVIEKAKFWVMPKKKK